MEDESNGQNVAAEKLQSLNKIIVRSKEDKNFVICQVKIVEWVAYYGQSSVKIVTFAEIVAKVAKKVKTVRQDPGWSSSLEKSPSNTNVSHP